MSAPKKMMVGKPVIWYFSANFFSLFASYSLEMTVVCGGASNR